MNASQWLARPSPRIRLPLAALAIAAGSALQTEASFIKYEFSGVVTGTTGILFAGDVGERFTGSFVYDSASPATGTNATNGFYDNALLSFIVDDISLSPVQLRVHNEAQLSTNRDTLTLFAGNGVNDVRLNLMGTGTVFSSLDIPETLDLSDFNVLSQIVKLPPAPGVVPDHGTIDTLTNVPVPEPSTVVLGSLALMVLLAYGWRRGEVA